jgi:Flp pilus assembly protein TadG
MKRQRTRGQALVELAITFPILMGILAGMTQAGFLLWGYNSLNQVVRDTGRYAATLNADCATVDEADAEAKAVAIRNQAGGPWTSFTIDVEYVKDNGTAATACPADNQEKIWVEVVASAQVPAIFPILPTSVSSSTRFRVEPKP